MIDNILSVRNLSVTYKKNKRNIKVLHEINLDIKKGESLGIVGESGSGKTTICRSIIGAGPITTGEIFFENKPIRGRKNDCEKLIEEFIQSHEQLSENEMFFTRKLYRIVKTISNNAANKIIINSAEKMLQINNISVTVLNRLFEIVNSLHICQPKAK
jgi:ABC-type oligopeptide transport system ATPase subunit